MKDRTALSTAIVRLEAARAVQGQALLKWFDKLTPEELGAIAAVSARKGKASAPAKAADCERKRRALWAELAGMLQAMCNTCGGQGQTAKPYAHGHSQLLGGGGGGGAGPQGLGGAYLLTYAGGGFIGGGCGGGGVSYQPCPDCAGTGAGRKPL